MKKKVKYDVGDVLEITLEPEGTKGYGRVLKTDPPSLFVELYGLPQDATFQVSEVDSYPVILKIWCTENGFKKGQWKIIGNTVVEQFEMPDFVTADALTGELQIVRGEHRLPATKELLEHAQPYGIFLHEAVRIRYLHELRKAKLAD